MRRRLSQLAAIVRRWRRVDAHDRALDAELQAYLQSDIDARVRAGDSPAVAGASVSPPRSSAASRSAWPR